MKPLYIVLIVLLLVIVVLTTLYLLNRFVWFYRDPPRTADATGDVFISPADGQVVYVKKFTGGKVVSSKLGRDIKLTELTDLDLPEHADGWIVGIYMSPFDVHFNYAPAPGKIKRIAYTKAKANVPMVDLWEYIKFTYLRQAIDNFSAKFHLVNERNSLLVEGPGFDYAVIEIADKFVNKITCYVEEGQNLKTGDKVGFIDRGSQVDLIIYKTDIEIKITEGQQVYGGKTVIASY
ncbi:MAG: phosphatidylserine decarboxylase [Actinomycetota bacterium]